MQKLQSSNAPSTPRQLAIGSVHFSLHDWGITTHFPDNTYLNATPHDTHHYHVIAHRCGYTDDIVRYCQEHEFFHIFVSTYVLYRDSILHTLALGFIPARSQAVGEELLTQTMQRWVRANEEPIISDVDWYSLRTRALELLASSI